METTQAELLQTVFWLHYRHYAINIMSVYITPLLAGYLLLFFLKNIYSTIILQYYIYSSTETLRHIQRNDALESSEMKIFFITQKYSKWL